MPPPSDVHALAARLFDDLGRQLLGESLAARGWTFGFDRARTRLGMCRFPERHISLSRHLAATLPRAEVEDTVRHEIAHAIDAERRGHSAHDATWRALAVACGARPQRLFAGDLPPDPDAPYHASCPSCGSGVPRYREPVRPLRCRACHRSGQPAVLRVVHQATGAVIWPGGTTPGPFGGSTGLSATCPGCGTTFRRTREPRRATGCGSCCARSNGGRYDPRFHLMFS